MRPMHTPTEITFHHLETSAAVEAAVHRWVVRLEHVDDRLDRCAVRIEPTHRTLLGGRDFIVTVAADLPGGAAFAAQATHLDIYVAVADAFRAVRRQLLAHRGPRANDARLRASP